MEEFVSWEEGSCRWRVERRWETNTCLGELFQYLQTKSTIRGDLMVEQCNAVVVMEVVKPLIKEHQHRAVARKLRVPKLIHAAAARTHTNQHRHYS